MKRGIVMAWVIAELLASPDPDVQAGIQAYENEEYDAALEAYAAAQERLGGAPEVEFNRALVLIANGKPDEAKTVLDGVVLAESDLPDLQSSALYELGNLAFDAEDWDGAIEKYIECLKLRPGHGNAKWNLELALQKKKEAEEEQEKNEEEQDENEDENEEQDKEDEDKEDEDKEDEDKQDEDKEDEDKEDEQEEEPKEDEPQEDEKQDEPKEEEPPAPQPIDKMDLDKALDKLDQQDPLSLDKVQGGYVQPQKDW